MEVSCSGPTRIVVAGLPGILRDIVVQLVDGAADTEVIDAPLDLEGVDSVAALRPDVVIVGLSGSELPSAGEWLFQRLPWVKVLGITLDGRRAFLYELRPLRVPLGELSPDSLGRAIREAARQSQQARVYSADGLRSRG